MNQRPDDVDWLQAPEQIMALQVRVAQMNAMLANQRRAGVRAAWTAFACGAASMLALILGVVHMTQ